MKQPVKPINNGGGKLPPGATSAGVPGTAASRKVTGAPRPAPVIVDPKKFGTDHRGSPELKIGKGHFELDDGRSRIPR
jgi:hypothetical protein